VAPRRISREVAAAAAAEEEEDYSMNDC